MSDPATSIFIGAGPGGAHPQALELKRANRHGLIAGAIDIRDKVAAQLNNRVQHKLNAFTPRDQAARPSLTDKIIVSATRAVTSSMARQLGTQIMRGVLGGLFRGR